MHIRVHIGGDWHEYRDLPSALAAVGTDPHRRRGEQHVPEPKAGTPFVFVTARDPGPEDIMAIKDVFPLSRGLADDIRDGAGHVRVDYVDGTLYLSVRSLTYHDDTSAVETSFLHVIQQSRVLVMLSYGEDTVVEDTVARVTAPGAELPRGLASVIGLAIARTVETYTQVDQDLADDVADLEALVFTQTKRLDPSERIYALKREVAEVRRALLPLVGPLRDLVSLYGDHMPSQTQAAIRRMSNVTTRTLEHVDSHDRLLGDMLSAHLAMVGVQQNTDMRKISAWAAMALVPTIVGAIYGMNFKHMPELSWTFGYPLAIGLVAVICALLYRRFKKSGWL